jgi:hypothetical protein
MSEPGPELNQSFIPPNAFNDTSPEAQALLNDIGNIIGGKQQSSLSTQMQNAAKAAGVEARTSKTVEGEREIYKKHLNNATKVGYKSQAPLTSGDVRDWEALAKRSRNG